MTQEEQLSYFLIFIVIFALIAENASANNTKKLTYFSEVQITNVQRATNLAIDTKNTVFFSYDSTTFGTIYYLARYNLRTQEFKHVENIDNGRAVLIDYRTDVKYFGAGQNIYKYNDDTNKAEYITQVPSIYALHMLDDIAFTDIMGDVFQINGAHIQAVENLKSLRLMTVDRNRKIFYINDTGLYDFDPKYNETRQYFVNGRQSFYTKAMSLDKYDNVFIGGIDGIFKLNQNNCTATKIGRFNNIYGLAFDKFNNIVYSNENQLIRAYVKINY